MTYVCLSPAQVNAVRLEDVGDRAASDFMAEIRERAFDTRIAPRRIVERRIQYDEINDLLHDTRPSGPRRSPVIERLPPVRARHRIKVSGVTKVLSSISTFRLRTFAFLASDAIPHR